MAGLHFDITADNSNFMRKIKETRDGVENASKQIEQNGIGIEDMFNRMSKAAAYFGVSLGAKELITQVATVRGEFQKLEVAFTTLLGSKDESDALMSQLVNTAAITSFGLQDVADGARQLLAYGTASEKVNETLIRLGDIAAGLSIPLGDLVYLYGTTMSQGQLFTQDLRQFMGRGIPLADELAKQFGVTKDKVGELVTAGKVGFQEVENAIVSMTSKGSRFGGLMEAQSKTISGQIGNIEDSIETMLNDIGKANEGVINDALGIVSSLIKNYEEIGKAISELVVAYGAYRAILITITALQKAYTAVLAQSKLEMALAATAGQVLTESQAMAAAKTKLLTIAQAGLVSTLKKASAALLSNPYALMTAAVVSLGYAMYKLITYQTDAQKHQGNLNKSLKDFNVEIAKEESATKYLFDALDRTNKGTRERANLIKQVNEKYGSYLPNLLSENASLAEIKMAYDRINLSIKEHVALKMKSEALDNVNKDSISEQIESINKIREALTSQVGSGMADSIIQDVQNTTDLFQKAGSSWQKTLQQVYYDAQRKAGKNSFGNNFAESLEDYVRNVFDTQKAIGDIERAYKPFLDNVNKKIEEVEKEVPEKHNKSYWEKIKKNAEEARNALADTEKGSKEWNRLTKVIEDAKLKLTTWEDSSKTQKVNEKRLKEQESLRNELLDMIRQSQQAEIDLMKEGYDKKIAQIELDYDNEIDAIISKKKELAEAQGGKLTDEQEGVILQSMRDAWMKKHVSTTKVEKTEFDSERDAMNEYLKEYGNYMEKRNAIKAIYDEKLSKATTKGERLSLGEAMKKELSDLDIEANKTTSAISQLFGDMADKTIKELDRINERGEAALEFLKMGVWDKNKGNELGITKETFDIWSKSPDKLKDISDALKDNKEAADNLRPSYDLVKIGLEEMFNAGNDSKKLETAFNKIQSGLGKITNAAGFLSDTLGSLGDAFGSKALGSISESINIATDAIGKGMKGAEAAMSLGLGGIGAAAGAAIGVVSSLAGAIAKIHDKNNERRIEKLQDQIDTLDKSYENLGDSIEKAYSKDASKLIGQQNKLLEQQKKLIQAQIKEEEAKKKTDKERIKDWKDQIEEINKTIADNKEKAVDAIFGEDLQSAIDNFASSYADAWASGTDKAVSAKDTVRNMMKQMATESIKEMIKTSGKMDEIRNKLKEFYADNVLSGWEQDYIYNMAENLQKELDEQFGWAGSLMGDKSGKYEQKATSGGFQAMSQDSANELNGRFTALKMLGEEIKNQMIAVTMGVNSLISMSTSSDETLRNILNMHVLSNNYLEDISGFQKKIHDLLNSKLPNIEMKMSNL